ncbi:unnamed protein product [Brassicogethes aeneus]|uniref:U6 snRNA phosphodiesterase n=1 Tax=Brassicogethes aeneus TaxID=1431903 RepID=A0A9P0FC22_BRAAE|nr:unnamed protein product [Brassicogethes aeneus]
MANKSALALICIYGEDSSDDDVSGPRVSTKRVHKDEDEENAVKRRERLPLPSEFQKVENVSEYTDDPSNHEGRLRSFPHERGNWATYIYIPYDKDHFGIQDLFSKIQLIIPSTIEIKPVDDLHISLTKTVILKHHWIQSFSDSIKENTIFIKKFMIMFDGIKVYCNEERTRTFLGITVKSGHDSLIKLVEIFDRCLLEYKLSTFYKDPSFHMSIAWVQGDFKEELGKYVTEINNVFIQLLNTYTQDTWYIYVNYLLCKIGNKSFQFNLC